MLSKNKIKYINSLQQKKYRETENCFIAEGTKIVEELLKSSLNIKTIIATNQWFDNFRNIPQNIECVETNIDGLKKISALVTPQEVIAVVQKPVWQLNESSFKDNLVIALDEIKDPGNMGTIIRLADWFGIEYVLCSDNCVDVYNPKVVQATMGAFCRVKTIFTDLSAILKNALVRNIPVYGTFLNGSSMYDTNLSKNGIIVMGNESNGISAEIEKLVSHRLFIPNYPPGQPTSESLNVSVATAVICAEFRRNCLQNESK